MKANELMIGDWVQGFLPNTNSKIVGILNDIQVAIYGGGAYIELDVDDLQPIPLTPEILEKNGFVKSERFDVWKIIEEHLEIRVSHWRVAIIFIDDLGSDECEYSFPRPKFVHELQHALRLCGIDKEIVL